MVLFSPNSRAFGLEITTHRLRVILVHQSYFGSSVEAVNELQLERNPWLKNGIRNKQQVAETIQKALSLSQPKPITLTKAIASLPEASVFSKVIVMPKLKGKELAQAIPYEAAEFLPLPIEEMYLDWQIDPRQFEGEGEASVHVFLVAAPKNLVDELRQLAKMAGLQLIGLKSQPFALADSLNHRLEDRVLKAIVEIDTKVTTLVLATREAIKLTATIPTGSLALKARPKGQTRYLADEINEGIAYYHNRLGERQAVKTILLTGEGATLPGLPERLSEYGGTLCQIGYPVVKLPNNRPIHPRFNTVLGLALGEN